MSKFKVLMASALMLSPSTALAVPVSQWWSGWGQGISEYAIQNERTGRNEIYIACHDYDKEPSISFKVAGQSPEPNSAITATIDHQEYYWHTNDMGLIIPSYPENSTHFELLWTALRGGSTMTVTLSTGKSATFTLKGSAKIIPAQVCTPESSE